MPKNSCSGRSNLTTYGLFGFLGHEDRNYSKVPAVAGLRDLPADISGEVRAAFDEWGTEAHSPSWLSVDELTGFDYSATFEDRRITHDHNGSVTTEPGDGKLKTFADIIGKWFFRELDMLKTMNEQRPTRIIFWFDN
jgi:hypothetical protein